MLTDDDKKELQRKRGESLHQWVMRIGGYFHAMTDGECSTTLYNVVSEAYRTGAKEAGKSSIMSEGKKKARALAMPKMPKQKKPKKVTAEYSIIEKMDLNIKLTGLSQRAQNVLEKAGVFTIGEVVQYTRDELRKLPRAGTAFIFEIENMLEKYGLSLSGAVKHS